VALLRAQRWHEAQACLAQLDHNDELVRALSALTCAHAAPREAIQQLQQIQRNAQQQSARELAREVLLALEQSEESAAVAESDLLDLAN
jgi:pyruvate kinase